MTKTGKRRRPLLPVLFYLAFCLLTLISSFQALQAGEASLHASLQGRSGQARVALGESARLELTLTSDGAEPKSSPSFHAPGLQVLGQSTRSSVSMQLINGNSRIEKRYNYSYDLQAQQLGMFKISEIVLHLNGKRLQAPELTLEVVQANHSQAQPGPGQHQQQQHNSGQEQAQNANQNVWLEAQVSSPRVYKGERLELNYYIYHPSQLYNLSLQKLPQLEGFLKDEIDLPTGNRQLVSEMVVVQGQSFQRTRLARYALYPLQTGKVQIDSFGIRYQIFSDGREEDDLDPFLNFFQHLRPKSGQLVSKPIEIEVLALPETNKPQAFSGAVGTFKLTLTADRAKVDLHQALSLNLRVEGQGNLKSIKPPQIDVPAGFQAYNSKVSQNKSEAPADGLQERVFETVMVARQAGVWKIPAVRFNFFDPNTHSYRTVSSNQLEIQVLGAALGGGAPDDRPFKPEAQAAAQAVNPSVQQEKQAPQGPVSPFVPLESPSSSVLWTALACVLLLLALGLLIRDWLYPFAQKGLKKLSERSRASSFKDWRKTSQWREIKAGLKRLRESQPGAEVESKRQKQDILEKLEYLLAAQVQKSLKINLHGATRSQIQEAFFKQDSQVGSKKSSKKGKKAALNAEASFLALSNLLDQFDALRYGGEASLLSLQMEELESLVSDFEVVLGKI